VILSYKKGYKYQTTEAAVWQLRSFRPDEEINTPFCGMTMEGKLNIKSRYAWDGPSGPTIDTDNFMIGSLIHDVLYELMRGEYVPHYRWREADMELDHINELCGMSRYRRWWVRKGLLFAGGSAAHPDQKKEVFEIDLLNGAQ